MYVACQEELARALRAAGCEKVPFTSFKKMSICSESRLSAVLCESEEVRHSSAKKFYASPTNERYKRSRLFDRDIIYTVVIGDYTYEKVEETYTRFLRELPTGIYVDGNHVAIEPADTQWMGEKDHILHAKVTVQIKITCHGGLYKDSDMASIKDIDVMIRKEE